MKTLVKGFKKGIRPIGPPQYFYEIDREDPKDYLRGRTIYEEANALEESTMFELESYTQSDKLDHIIKEIKLRVRITAQEAFKIGELLSLAKKICQEEKILFKNWIKEHFDFSYETANNFMHVFHNCMGFRQIALEIPSSILYKLSSPGISDELREFLFKYGNLERISNGQFKKLVKKCKEKGVEAVMEDIEEINRGSIIYHQTAHTLDIVENVLRTLVDTKEKLEKGGNIQKWSRAEFGDQVEGYEKEAKEVNLKLYNSLLTSIESLKNAWDESITFMNEYQEKIKSKM